MDLEKIVCFVVKCYYVKDQWRAFVNTVIKLHIT